MKRNFRITKTNDFIRTRTEGRKQSSKFAVLLYNKNGLSSSRAAVVASKKIGNAVRRNRTKRILRAVLDKLWNKIQPGWDIIFYARPAISNTSFEQLCDVIESLLYEAKLMI